MEIRCKRCFKKYDGSFPLCPRCGKASEYKTSNKYNSYQTKAKKKSEKEVRNRFKVEEKHEFIIKGENKFNVEERNEFRIENGNRFEMQYSKVVSILKNMISNKKNEEDDYDEFEYDDSYKYDVLDTIWFKVSKKIKFLIKPLLIYRHCEFCGAESYQSLYNCPICKNGFAVNFDTSKTADDYPSQGRLLNMIDEFVKSRSGFIDVDEFKSKLAACGYNLDNWNLNGELKTGVGVNKYFSMAIYSSILFFVFIGVASGSTASVIRGWFVVLMMLGNILIIPLSRKWFSEYLVMNKESISVTSTQIQSQNQNRNRTEIYSINTIDLKSIELVFDYKMALENIIFRSKKGYNVKNLVYSLSVLNYVAKKSIVEYIMLYITKNDISLYITRKMPEHEIITETEDIEETEDPSNHNLESSSSQHIKEDIANINSEILFVRIDTKVDGRTLTELEYTNHISYLKNISSNGYFMAGGFEKGRGGMIVFSAIDEIDANEIAKDDPLIMSGAYTYVLEEWKVILKSSSNYIS